MQLRLYSLQLDDLAALFPNDVLTFTLVCALVQWYIDIYDPKGPPLRNTLV